MKNKYTKGQKVKNKPLKNIFMVVGTLLFFIIVGGCAAWVTGYLPWITNHQTNLQPKLKTVAENKPVQKVVPYTSAAEVSNVAPKPFYDYQFPPIQNGMAPLVSRIPTKERVVFLTIDDGIVTNWNDAQLMQNNNVVATFFLVHRFIANDWNFFSKLAQQTGSDIENHSYDHALLPGLSYEVQKKDICSNADAFQQWFGKRPIIFRPSGGAYDSNTQLAATACGMQAIILWDAAINNGVIRYQYGRMQPGDIVLMHFRSTFQEDLKAFVQDSQSAGLKPALLVDLGA